MRKLDFDAPLRSDEAQPFYRTSAESPDIDAKPVQRRKRIPAEKASADDVPGSARSFDQLGGKAGAAEHDRRSRSRRAAADDQRGRSTHSRNGKQRTTFAAPGSTRASARISRHSAGRKDLAIDNCPSSRTIRCQPIKRQSKG